MKQRDKILIIYTGGTIGMLPKVEDDPASPLIPAGWDKIRRHIPSLKDLQIGVDLHEMDLIDSSDMNPDYWIEIVRVIGKKYPEYDGFVILHGTDTMTYTASALSFLLENLGKPIMITGSQLPMSDPRSDAVQNLVTAVMLAAPGHFDLPMIPEVCIFFRNVLLRGNRARKISSSAYAGFHSPNCPVLGRVGEHIKIDLNVVRPVITESFFYYENLEANVLMFDIFPGLKPEIIRKLFDVQRLKGVVLGTYGAGNAPTSPAFLREIEFGIKEKRLMIVNVTQCNEGAVEMNRYGAGAGLARLGVISGADMTPEAAIVKMQFLLGRGHDAEIAGKLMLRDLRGELTPGKSLK